MAGSRKRKAGVDTVYPTSDLENQRNIEQYGRIGKAQQTLQTSKKRKAFVEIVTTKSKPRASTSPVAKRRRPTTEIEEGTVAAAPSVEQQEVGVQAKTVTKSSKKRQRDEEITTPQIKRHKNALLLSPEATPSKSVHNLFDKLNIGAPALKLQATTSPQDDVYNTPPLTPKPSLNFPDIQPANTELPSSVSDLTDLFKSFLSALSLYYAHHGTNATLPLSTLTTLVTKTWKKRQVTVPDIILLLGILGDRQPVFQLVSNGSDVVNLEHAAHDIGKTGHLNQHALLARFDYNLRKHWESFLSRTLGTVPSVSAFLTQLPRAAVVVSAFAAQTAAPSKGQARLDMLKSTATLARAEHADAQKAALPATSKTTAAVSSRGASLLDRIIAKQTLASSRATGPTPAELDRRAALDRVEDVLPVLDMLCAGRQRASFADGELVRHLQQSLRNPISREEVVRVVEVLAGEICPGYVKVVSLGEVRGVVVTRAGKVSGAEVRRRVGVARGC